MILYLYILIVTINIVRACRPLKDLISAHHLFCILNKLTIYFFDNFYFIVNSIFAQIIRTYILLLSCKFPIFPIFFASFAENWKYIPVNLLLDC